MSRILRRLARYCRPGAAPAHTPRDLRARLWVAPLEERSVPATFTVNRLSDTGTGSGLVGDLRYCLAQANATPGVDNITFDSTLFATPRVILSSNGPLSITEAVTINGPGAGLATVNPNAFSQVFAVSAPGTTTIEGLTISGGLGGNGSGIGVSTSGSNLTVRNSVIIGNTGGTGGGIYMPPGAGLLTVQNSTITGNFGQTGGIYFYNGGGLLVQNSTISGNTGIATDVYNGGGIVFFGPVAGSGLLIENSTIANNRTSSSAGGGGINFRSATGTATVRNSTVTGNIAPATATGGGGIAIQGTLNLGLTNSVVAENTGPADGPDLRVSSGTAVGFNSLIGVVPPSGFTGTGNQTGTQATPLDPLLGPLSDNGGPTQTRVPLIGSPLIDVGDSTKIGTLTTDQRGVGGVRVFGAAVDIGAVEVQPLPPILTIAGGTVTYTENTPPVALDAGLTVADLDSPTLYAVSVEITGGLGPTDVLAFTPVGAISGVYAQPFGLLILSGEDTLANYQAVLRSLTFVAGGDNPAPGPRTITFVAEDMSGNVSAPVSRAVNVVAVNDAPVFINLPGTTTTTDTATVTPFDGLFITDVDAASVSVTVTFNDTNGTLTPTAGGNVTGGTFTFTGTALAAQTAIRGLVFTPVQNLAAYGTSVTTVFTLSVTDDATPTPAVTTDNSTAVVAINVNDAPAFTISTDPIVTTEDSATLVVPGFVTSFVPGPAEESGQTVDGYEIEVLSNPSLGVVSVSPSGDLSFDSFLHEFGTATYRIRVYDDGGFANGGVNFSDWQTFSVSVNPVNDFPGFNTVGVSFALEDSGTVTEPGFVTFFSPGPDNESGQVALAYPLVVLSGADLFTAGPFVDATGTLSYTLAPDAFGFASIQIQAQDDGGTDFGGVDLSFFVGYFSIFVSAVNDAPTFTADPLAPVNEDAGAVSVPGFVTAVDVGPDNEGAFEVVLGYEVEVLTGGSLFSSNPFIVSNGELLYTLAGNTYGSATFRARVYDSGGTADGGVDRSAWQTFTITVNPRNDAPVNTPLTNSIVAIGLTTLLAGLSVTEPIDNVPGVTAGYSTTVSVPAGKGTFGGAGFTAGVGTESITVTGTLAAVNAALATLTYTQVANDPSATITVVSSDGGNTGGGALADTDAFVLVVKVRPVVTLSAAPTTFTEDGGAVAADPGLTVADADSTELSRAVVRFSGLFLPAEDVLTYTGTLPAGVTADTSVAGEITFSGTAPVGDYVTLLRSVTYANTSQFPDVTARTVTFQVTDEVATSFLSNPAARPVAVDDLNDAPVNALAVGLPTVAEEGTVSLPGVSVSDVDLGTSPIKVTLSTTAGTLAVTGAGVTITGSGSSAVTVEGPAAAVNSALGNLTFTGATDFVGSAIIQVVSDDQGATGGPAQTDTDSFIVAVSPVNDAPSFTPGPNITVGEDSGAASYPSWATNILVGPADESAQTVTFLVSSNLPGVFTAAPAIDAAGNLTFAVRADAVGTATVTVRAQDNGGTAFGGVNTSAPRTFTITLAPVNDTPSFTRGDDISVTEDSGPRTFAGWARGITRGPIDEINQTVQFLVSTDDPGLFTAGGQPAVDANGTLTFTPAADANGSTTVRVRIKDSGGGPADTSAEQTFTLTVISLNDPPQFIVTQAAITAGPSTAPVTLANFVTNIKTGPPDEAAQTVQFEVTNNGEVLFSAQPAVSPDGTLTFTPAAFRSGVATVTVRLRDSGGDTFGVDVTPPVQTFTITVNGSNTAPTFTAGSSQTVFEDAGPQSVPGWATNLSAGLPGESGQTLTFLVTTNQPGLFAAPPAVSPTGTLTYTPAADAVGTASVTVRLMDSGGTAFGGVDTSAPQSFTITLSPVNDAPRFTVPGGPVASDPANGPRTVTNFATGIAAGPADEAGQAPSLTFLVSTNNNALFTALPTINPTTGTLTFTPAAGANGTATVTVQLQDAGGTANGGVNVSAPQTFSIVVAAGAQNSPPTAAADAITVTANSAPTAVPVLANDSTAPDTGETLTVTAVGSAAHGLATLTGGAVFYAPAAGFSGTDTFTYTVSDGSLTATATVTVTVTPPVGPTPTPTPTPPATVVRDLIAVADQTSPRVRVVNAATGAVVADFIAFPGFAGGVNATVADVTGDGTPDVIVGAGAGGGPVVKVFDGRTLAELTAFHAFLPSLRGGVHVAAADVNGDGVPDLVLGAGAGGGPHVKVVDGTRLNLRDADNLPAAGALIGSFFAYADNFLGGVSVAAADVDGDGRAEVVTGAGPGGSPHVKVYAGGTLKEILSVIPYNENFRGGVNVGAGDLDGDGLAEIITGAGAGGGPHVGIYDGKTGASKGQFFAFGPTDTSGVTVAVRPLSAGGATLAAALGGGDLKTFTAGVEADLLDGAILGGIAVG